MEPELSVDAVHARLIESSVAAVIRTFVGTVGAVTSGFGLPGGFAATAGAAPARTASATHALTITRIFIGTPPSYANGALTRTTAEPPGGIAVSISLDSSRLGSG